MQKCLEEKNNRFACIQLLRVIAAICVMLSHFGFGSLFFPDSDFSAGVNLFFCISAFLMMYTTNHTTPGKFLLKRAIRILPLYWLLTILTFVASWLVGGLGATQIPISEGVKSFFFIPFLRDGIMSDNIVRPIVGPAWTLAYDVWFMILFAVSMRICHKYRGVVACGFCVVFYGIGMCLPEGNPFSVFLGHEFWFNYVAGIFVYELWKRLFAEKQRSLMVSAGCVAVALTLFVLLFLSKKRVLLSTCYSAVILVCTLLAFGYHRMPAWVSAFGKISYSFYLTHYFVILIFGKIFDFSELSGKMIAEMLLTFVVMIGVAFASYLVVEEKFGGWIRKILLKK